MRRPRRRRRPEGAGLAFATTLMLHVAAAVMLIVSPGSARIAPPVYRVELVAAPRPEPEARRAPDVLERPAERAPPPPPRPAPARRTAVAPEAPPKEAQPTVEREPAPRTTPAEEPAPGVTPSTGADVATVSVPGVEFRYPEYLRNIVAEIYRRWHRPVDEAPLQAEMLFFIHRDGSISNVQFTRRSGSFAFDLEAQGAIEAAGNAHAFGPLPAGFEADLLPVTFFFNPRTVR
jgi:outer membrane biosynthesis protein TonB